MNKSQKSYHYLVSKIMIICLLLPAAAPLYYLLTRANLPVEEFLHVLNYAIVVMVLMGVISFYLHKKANQVTASKDKILANKLSYYESFLLKGHRLPRAFFTQDEKEKDNKESKLVWKLLLIPFPLMAYSPLLLLLITKDLPFAYFMGYLFLSFVGDILFGFYIFQKYKKVAQLYEATKERIFENNLSDMDILLINKEDRKNMLRAWQEAIKDETIINVIEKGVFDSNIKSGKLYKEFYYFWEGSSKEEQSINPKMAIQFYLLLEKVVI